MFQDHQNFQSKIQLKWSVGTGVLDSAWGWKVDESSCSLFPMNSMVSNQSVPALEEKDVSGQSFWHAHVVVLKTILIDKRGSKWAKNVQK